MRNGQRRGLRLGLGAAAGLMAMTAGIGMTAGPAAAKPVRIAATPTAVNTQAAPADYTCSYSYGERSFGVKCSFIGPVTGGGYQAYVTCTDGSTRYGPARGIHSGLWSTATCPVNVFRTGQGYFTW